MAKFLTTTGISHHIENIIIDARKKLVLVSPYLQISKTFLERLNDAATRKVLIKIIYGKDELNPNERNSLSQLKNIELFYFKNLHAKCYFNESEMVITSMNMYEFSEKNNREMGVHITKDMDTDIFDNAVNETQSIIQSSKKIELHNSNANTNNQSDDSIKLRYQEFTNLWYDKLKITYPNNTFYKTDTEITAKDFPFKNWKFSNSYGFATIEFPLGKDESRIIYDEHRLTIFNNMNDYRCFWNYPYNHISIYHYENFDFNNKIADINYCMYGLEQTINILENTIYEKVSKEKSSTFSDYLKKFPEHFVSQEYESISIDDFPHKFSNIRLCNDRIEIWLGDFKTRHIRDDVLEELKQNNFYSKISSTSKHNIILNIQPVDDYSNIIHELSERDTANLITILDVIQKHHKKCLIQT